MTADAAPSAGAGSRGAVVAVFAAVFAFSVLQTLVIPALSRIGADLDADPAAVGWVLSAFLLSSSVFTVILGRLGDLFGRRSMLLVALAALAAGSVLAAVAPTIGVLIGARVVQGVGAGTFPLAFGIIRESVRPEWIATTIGSLSAVFGIGFGLGLVIPGPIIDAAGWPWVFWLAAAISAIAGIAVLTLVPADRRRATARLDLGGAALFSAAVVALLLAIAEGRAWGPIALAALLAATVLLGAVFVTVERRHASPMIDVRLLRRPRLIGANLTALFLGVAMYGAFTLVPRLAQTPPSAGYGFGASVTVAGAFLLPMAATMLVTGPLAGRLGEKLGFATTLALSCVACAVGFAVLTAGFRSAIPVLVGVGILGLGIGGAFSAMANVVIAAVRNDETGEATGVNSILRTIGGAIGAQAAAVLASVATMPGSSTPLAWLYPVVFGGSAVAVLVAAGAGILASRAGDPASGAERD